MLEQPNAFTEGFNTVVNWVNGVIWGNDSWLIMDNPWFGLLVFVLIGAGIFFTVATRFIQFRHFGPFVLFLTSVKTENRRIKY